MPLTIELPSHESMAEFNLSRWRELMDDPWLSKIEGRIETDRYGHVIMSPPPNSFHGSYQSEIAFLLRTLLVAGRTITECPISTSDGVRAADVAWFSAERIASHREEVVFTVAPEICVEVLSPSNTVEEMRDKAALYFDAGALEFWQCTQEGAMNFQNSQGPLTGSILCPSFPKKVTLS